MNGTVGIAFAGSDGISQAGNEHIAHRNLGNQLLCRPVRQHNIDGGEGGPTIVHAKLDLFIAAGTHFTPVAVPIIEAPQTAIVRRHRARKRHADAVIARGKVILALTVALAGFEEIARAIGTQALHDISRPAAAVGLSRETPLGCKHGCAPAGGDMALKIRFVTEQPKSVLDLPFNAQGSPAVRLRAGSARAEQEQESDGA